MDRYLQYSLTTTKRVLESRIEITDRFTTDFTAFVATKDAAEKKMGQLVMNEDEQFRYWQCTNQQGNVVFSSHTLPITVHGVHVPESVLADSIRSESSLRAAKQIVHSR